MPSNQTYNVARGLVRAKSSAGGVSRLIFQNQTSNYIYNRFIPGSGVGGLNRSVRRYQYRHATSCENASGGQRISLQNITFSGVGSFETIYVNSLNQVVASPVLNGFTIYRVISTSPGASYVINNNNSASTPISFLIIGGGGSGAGFGGQAVQPGAGGAGGFIESSGTTNTANTYSIYVGRGGFLLNSTASGENSLLQLNSGTLNAIGGGGGANLSTGLNGLNGGSGGGGAFNFDNNNFGTGGNGTPGQGFSGAPGNIGGGSAGSGGGAGGSPDTNSRNGGPGLSSTITGQSIFYAGGGGGGGRTGGIGGGGNGGIGGPGGQGTPGTNGLGGGGGSGGTGASGGDGIVILRIPSFI